MSEKSKAKVKSRWGKNGERYPSGEAKALAKAHEQPGWRHGAKVYKRGGTK